MSYEILSAGGTIGSADDLNNASKLAACLSNGIITNEIDLPGSVVVVQDRQAPYGVVEIWESGVRMAW